MIRLIWTGLVLCLLTAVLYLGVKIFVRPAGVQNTLSQTSAQVQEKVGELKDEATKKLMEQAAAMVQQAALKNESGSVAKPVPARPATEEGAVKTPAPVPSKRETSQAAAVPDPLDEEDRQLTADIMGRRPDQGGAPEEGLHISRQDIASHVAAESNESAVQQPLDMTRMNRIRDSYARAIEVLNLN